MTSTNFTIDNINPLIQYAPPGAWSEGSDTLDPLGVDYSNGGTFTLSTTQGSSATFTFNGTQVFVAGAKRSNHGPYSITLDGTQTTFNGFSADPVFGPLFISDVLPQGLHTVTLTNQENNASFPFLDLDFITWTSTLPDQGESKNVEDTDSSFTYSPPTSWSSTGLSTLQLTGFSGNSGHTTQTTGASVTVAFSGTFITIFGPVGPTIARYTVQLDGVNAGTFNATKQAYYPQVALFSASGLSDGPHSLELVSQPATPGQILAIDFIQVSPTSTANATASSGSASSTSAAKKSSIGPAIGGAVGGVVVLAILILVICILFRRRRRREEDRNQMALEDKYSVPTAYPMNSTMSVPYAASNNASTPYVPSNNEFMPSAMGNSTMPYASAAAQSQYSMHSQSHLVQQGPYTDGPPSPPLTNPYGGMDSQSSSHGAGVAQRTYRTVNNDDSQLGHRSRLSSSDAGSGSGSGSVGPTSTVQSAGAAGLGAGGGNARRSKGGPLPLPPTANVPLPAGAARMYVPGREQDMGPLPPDYEQATEPYRSPS